jgi:hypothetical protein
MAITTVTATAIITIVKIIWSFLFLNIFLNDQSNSEPTAPGVAISVQFPHLHQIFVLSVLVLLDLYLNSLNNVFLFLLLEILEMCEEFK